MRPLRFHGARALVTLGAAWLVTTLLFPSVHSTAQQETEPENSSGTPATADVLWVTYDGVIGTITTDFLVGAIDAAQQRGADYLVIELDTPGGLETAMRDIIKRILASEVPVVVYVSPSGSRAASAGVFLALAAHAVAMAPGTNMGAAHPVTLGGAADSTLTAKATNDAVAYIRSLADERGRDADWAEAAVRQNASIAADEAVARGLVDCVARNRAELFAKLDGKVVRTTGGEQTLSLANATVTEHRMSKRHQLLTLLNNPNVAYLLLLLGFYGLFFEIATPGVILPGVVGAICLILGLFALHTFSINYAGLLLMLLGIGFFIAELMTPTHGVLTAGGVISLGLGSLMLFRSPAPFLRVSLSVMIPALGVSALFFAFATTMAIRTRRKRPTTGKRGLVGETGQARTRLDPRGQVFIQGAHWTAEADEPVEAGNEVVVERIDGLVLIVRAADPRRKEG